MKKRKLVNQMVSFIMAFVMIIGCLANMPAMANAATSTEVAEDVTVEEETEEVVEDTAEETVIENSQTVETTNTSSSILDINGDLGDNFVDFIDDIIQDWRIDDFEFLEEYLTTFEDAIEVNDVEEYCEYVPGFVYTPTSAVDNSTNENKKYLPQVRSQGSTASCTAYAYVYTLGTYTINKARNIDTEKSGNNSLSPYFAYNITRYGTDTIYGSMPNEACKLMLEIGAPLIEYAKGSISHWDHTWYPTEEAWMSATDNRIEKVISIPEVGGEDSQITSPSDPDLDIIKATLSSGKIIGFMTYFDSFHYTTIPSDSPSHANEQAVDGCIQANKEDIIIGLDGEDPSSLHSMVIVGYDDNIWIDINNDGKQQEAEFGALKIMNSHGTDYGNDGFIWLAYDALNEYSALVPKEEINSFYSRALVPVGEEKDYSYLLEGPFLGRYPFFRCMYTFIASEEESASSGCRLVATLCTDDRENMNMIISAKSKETGETYTYKVYPFNVSPSIYYGGRAFDGTQNAKDGTIVIDLDNVISDITPETMDKYEWSVMIFGGDSERDKLHFDINGVECYSSEESSLYSSIARFFIRTYDMVKNPLSVAVDIKDRDSSIEYYTEGEQVELKAEINGGCYAPEQHIEYQFSIGNPADKEKKILREYSSESTFTWTAEKIPNGDYVFLYVTARDTETGETDVAYLSNIEINEKPYIASETITNCENIALGEPVEIDITGAGGTGNLKKIIVYSRYGYKTKYVICDEETDETIKWTPKVPGNYTLYLCVEDENGIRSECHEYEVTVKNIDFDIELSTPIDEITESMDVDITVKAEDGYDYQFYYETSFGKTIIKDFDGTERCEETVTWTADYQYVGYYSGIGVMAEELSTGCVYSKFVTFKVNPTPKIYEYSVENTEMRIGDKNTIRTRAWSGGTGELTHILEVSYNGGDRTLYDSRVSGYFMWKPEQIGTYTLWLSIEDELGAKDTKEFTVEVLGIDIKSFETSHEASETTEGMDVTFSVETEGGFDVQYQYVYCPGLGDNVIIKDYSYDTTCTWTAEFSYYNPTIIVYAKDMVTGEIVSKTMDFKVNKAPVISGCSVTSGEMELGESKKVAISFPSNSTGTGELKYVIEYSHNGGEKKVYYSSTEKSNVYWTPEESGIYTLWLSIEDENGIRDTHEAIIEVSVLKITSFDISNNGNVTEGMDVEISVATKNGVDVQYQYVYSPRVGEEVIIKDYSSDTTCTWVAEHSYYNPKIIVNIKDLETGEVATARMEIKIGKAPYISGCSITSGEMELGESKQVLISGSGGTGTLNRVVEVSYNGGAKTVYYEGAYKSDLYWTPDKAGTYTLWLSLEDENGIRATYEATIYVKNTVAVYYYNSSYSNAYIHYKVDNGSWTTAPGVKMESSSEQDGYTWKYVIDLGTETGATVCFNNGNGSWDSRNGANYTVGVGNYGIKNSAVSQLEEVSSIKFTVDKTSPVSVTDSATLSVTVNGSTDSYEYRFGTIFGGEEIILSNGYTTSSSYIMSMSNIIGNVNAKAVGTHTLFVDVKNTTTGEVERATIDNYVVEGLKITSFTADKVSPQMTGTSIALNVTVENEATYNYNTYKFSAIKDGIETVISNSDEYSATWTPTEAGTYTLKYYIVDNYGQTATKTMEYVVKDASATTTTIYYSNSSWSQAYIHYQIGSGAWTRVPGVKMESNTSGNGYTWKYVLDLGSASSATVCFNNGNGSWDSNNSSNYTLGLGVFGIKNSTITELEEKLSVSVSADKSVGGTYNTTTFTAVATNGTAPYTYKIAVVTAGTTPTDSSYVTANSNGTYLYTPYTAGSYTVYAKVTDANGDTAVTSMSYTIEGPKWSSFTATAADNKVGTAVTLEAEFVNYQYDPYNTYSFVVEKDGVSTTYSAGSTGYYVWTPTEEGTYTITAKFTTFAGSSYTKSMTYEVSSDKANTVTIYYNTSWTNANIHYCVAGGSWTAVPGVAMTATSEKSGYTHKYVIDLGDATSATICFNNGSGTWDSQNGSNYTVYAGTYGVSGGTVYELD